MKKLQASFLLSVIPIAILSACNTDPAFKERSRTLTNDEIAQAARRTGTDAAGDESRKSDSESNVPNSDDATAANGSGSSEDKNNDGIPDALQPGVVGTSGTGADGTRGGIGENGNDGTRDGQNETPVVGLPPQVTPTPAVLPPTASQGASVVFNTSQQQGKVDVLWVVDDSGSMKWAQDQLTGKFASFAQKLTDARVNFQVGVTSTDVCQINWNTGVAVASPECPDASIVSGGAMVGGRMVGPLRGEFVTDSATGQKIMRPGSGFVDQFKRTAKIGTNGSSMEHGLSAAKLAIEKARSGVNSGFLRSDAFLSVVVLSDEEDDGVQMWCEDAWGRTTTNAQGQKDLNACKKGGNSPFLDIFGHAPFAITNIANTNTPMTNYKFTASNFKAYLDDAAVKGVGKFRVSAITGIRGQDGNIVCNNPEIAAGQGPRESGTNYIKAAQMTGGVVENICSPSWDTVLTNIGRNVGELANKIALPAGKVPYPGTLEVRVDGVLQPASSYFVESQGNFLVFRTIPASGAAINVKYKETVY